MKKMLDDGFSKKRARPMRHLLLALLCAVTTSAAVTPSQYWRDYAGYNALGPTGEALLPGSVVRAYDPDSVECGVDTTQIAGLWGYLHVYGDDPATPEDEGALPGDTLTFTVDGIPYFALPVAVWEAGDRTQTELDLFPGNSRYIIGDVRYGPSQVPVPDALISLTGPESTILSSGVNGRFTYGPLEEATYTIAFGSVEPEAFRTAVTAYDAALILQDVVGSRELDVPIEVADVSGDGGITAFDASQILQYVVQSIGAFDRPDTVWVNQSSVTLNYQFGEFPTASFLIQAVGDVSGNWSPVAPDARPAPVSPSVMVAKASGTYRYLIATSTPVYAVSGEVGASSERVAFELPDDWQITLAKQAGALHFAAAGATPLPPRASLFSTKAPVSFKGMLNEVDVISVTSAAPERWYLDQNAPNPFNPSTSVAFAVASGGFVELAVYDQVGRRVRTLVAEHRGSGSHVASWDARDGAGRNVASGVYILRLVTDDGVRTQRMTVLR